MVLKSDIGVHDNLFGGQLMAWLDIAGAAYAMEFCESNTMVTKKVSELVFNNPVKVGNLLKIYGEIIKVGNTSITLKAKVVKIDPAERKEVNICDAEMVFVQVNAHGMAVHLRGNIKQKFEDKL